MVWLKLLKFAALGFGALFALVVVLSVLLAVLGTLVGLGIAVFTMVFLAVFFAAVLASTAAMVYGASVLLSRSGGSPEPSSIPIDEPADPIERLKQRYAEDELTESELERHLERELGGDEDPLDRELARERER